MAQRNEGIKKYLNNCTNKIHELCSFCCQKINRSNYSHEHAQHLCQTYMKLYCTKKTFWEIKLSSDLWLQNGIVCEHSNKELGCDTGYYKPFPLLQVHSHLRTTFQPPQDIKLFILIWRHFFFYTLAFISIIFEKLQKFIFFISKYNEYSYFARIVWIIIWR